jgi:hypothetical protein
MKSDFLQPRFDGARFSDHTLPLEVARDLVAYERLVLELAKRLFLTDHPERQRVPKGFGADFHLHLERIDDGCARPLLALVAAGALALGDGANAYFERARDLITECIGAPEGQLPPDFPSDLLIHFNQIGGSLRPDESMEFPKEGGQMAVLNPARRKNLVLAGATVYERQIDLNGPIVEANWEKSSFQMRLADGTLVTVPMPDSFHPEARSSGGRLRDHVTVKGFASYDSWDRLQKVVSVNSLEVQKDFHLATRFDELRSLESGWHDGAGIAPDKEALDQVADRLVGHFPESLPLPAIVPTPEGNLLLEWNSTGDPSLDICLPDMTAEFHAFRDEADVEESFTLAAPDEWKRLFATLAKNIQHPGA